MKTIFMTAGKARGTPQAKAQTTAPGVINYTPPQSSFLAPTQKKLQLILKTAFSEHSYEFAIDSDGLTA
ncbi:MAG: hypothetical protein A2283_02015 [Lentisphaerae bacterium RIFOXYA12_FULL_48_11]|nr:MAG: hypothetical protein A2283_02015 [Lentisphaerae bacterium RIFOXYA12_FULL_48_11]